MEPDAQDDLPPEPSVEETREALRRRAEQARRRSARLRQAYRATLRECTARREHDHAVEHAISCAAHDGDVTARDAVLRRYAPMLSALARRYSQESSARHAELLSAGFSSLLTAIETWEPAGEVSLRDYARERARHAIETHEVDRPGHGCLPSTRHGRFEDR